MGFLVGLLVFFLALIGFCVWRISSQGFSLATAKRWLLYIFTALLIIGCFWTCYFYAMSRGFGDDLFVKWMNIVLTAAFVFGNAVKKFWQFRRRWAFWAEIGVLIVAHFAVLQRLHWETASYFWLIVVIGLPELAVVFYLFGLMFIVKRESPPVNPIT
jgi:hypothetical protein